MTQESESTFSSLKSILQKHAAGLSVAADTARRFCLEGSVGPATLHAWGGKVKRPTIPVAWVEIKGFYVSYHLMGVYGNTALSREMSAELKACMHGKTCFNFKTDDEGLFKELDQLTEKGIASFRKAGFISG
jgi:hypothetical protein